MKRNARPAVTDPRSDWQRAQAKVCGCGGSDDYCACQNEDAPWRYGLGPKPRHSATDDRAPADCIAELRALVTWAEQNGVTYISVEASDLREALTQLSAATS